MLAPHTWERDYAPLLGSVHELLCRHPAVFSVHPATGAVALQPRPLQLPPPSHATPLPMLPPPSPLPMLVTPLAPQYRAAPPSPATNQLPVQRNGTQAGGSTHAPLAGCCCRKGPSRRAILSERSL